MVRAKGLVRFNDSPGEMFVWNRVSGRQKVLLDPSWPHADALPVALFIGVNLPVATLTEKLLALGSNIQTTTTDVSLVTGQ